MNAGRAAVAAFNERDTVPLEQFGWDTYRARLARYDLYAAYYNNIVYSNISAIADKLKLDHGLYKKTRGIYNPVYRQNQLLVSFIYGGSLDMEHLTGGAIPIVASNEYLLEAIRQIWKWSRWGEQKSLFVRWGALYGDMALKIVDDRLKEKVRLEVLHPGKIREADFDEVGNVTSVMIEYEREEQPDVVGMAPSRLGINPTPNKPPKCYTYGEKITKDKFYTYKNGDPFAYYTDANGKLVPEWDNEYGFVPLVIGNHAATGLRWGANSFFNTTRKIDEINDAASLLNDQVRKIVIPLLYAKNVRQANEIKVAAEERDKYTIIYGPENSELNAVAAQIDLAGALKNLQEMGMELERDLPELALQRMREMGGNFTAPGVQATYSDAIGRIVEARGNYDHTLVRAMQMAASIGGYNGYEGFAGINLDSYDRGDLDMYIKDRPVIADSLSLSERLEALNGVAKLPAALQRLALREMDYSDEEIEDVVLDTEAQVRNAARGLADSIFGNLPDDEGDAQSVDGQPPQQPAPNMMEPAYG
jgi:hypothetical protein